MAFEEPGGVGVGCRAETGWDSGAEIHDEFQRLMSLAFLTAVPRFFGSRFFERAAENLISYLSFSLYLSYLVEFVGT